MANPNELMRDVLESLKKYNDFELMNKAMALQMEVLEQDRKIILLNQELAAARLEQTNKLKLTPFGETHYYVIEGQDTAYCAVCYGKSQTLIPLPAAREKVGGFGRVCPNCKNLFVEDSSRHASISLNVVRG